jgi:hypothetical protein
MAPGSTVRAAVIACIAAVLLSNETFAAAVSIVSAPSTLPRDTPAPDYSPLVILGYSGLEQQTYTIRVHLLETQTGSFNCGCSSLTTMWCNASFVVDNQDGSNAAGTIADARMTNVHNFTGFLWVVDLYNQAGTKIATAQQSASSTTNRAPRLAPIGNKAVNVGQSLDFTVTVSDTEGDPVTRTAENLPPGATFDGGTGEFHWQPAAAGTFPEVRFLAGQSSPAALADAELIAIQAGDPPPAGELAFSASTRTAAEAGAATLTVTRANGSSGTVTVAYSTVAGTATAGADYVSASGTLTFGDGEVSRTLQVAAVNDLAIEGNETFRVDLSAPGGGATLGVPSSVTVTIVDDDDPQLAGQWGPVAAWPVVPIHMHLLPGGKVMFWDRHNDGVMPPWDGTPHLWDPASPAAFTPLPTPGWDLFCSGHSFLADGRLFVAGGHIADFHGTATAGIYDPVANAWTQLPDMNSGRWYPSSTTLASGDVLLLSGTQHDYGDINPLPQVWDVAAGAWRNLTTALMGNLFEWPDFYPYAYAAPNGKVFVAGPQQTARYLDTAGTGAWTDVADSSLLYRDYGSSVMYDEGRVLIAGGNPRDDDPDIPVNLPSPSVEVIDLAAPVPAWRSVAPMSIGRRHHNTTLLPDGTVLVTGGSSAAGLDNPAGKVLYAELWNPSAETWTFLAAHNRYRGYHSNALLLPDGRVVVAGGGHPDPPGGSAEANAEIYSPPYLFRGARPVITSVPATVTYGQTFPVETPDAAAVTAVTWIRLGSVTHAFNENQRINRLAFSQSGTTLNVTAPATGNLCPPGDYMLFILNGSGVPSVARIVRIAVAPLQLATVAPKAGRSSGGQQVQVTGAFAGLASVSMGGVDATWSFTGGTSGIVVTTPAHVPGAVPIVLTPWWGNPVTRPDGFAFLRTTFTDDVIIAQSTPVKAVHVNELRAMVEALRAVAALSAPAWTDPLLAPATVVKAAHINELRTFLEQAAASLGFTVKSYTDTPLAIGTKVRRLHVEELRQRIREIAG